MTATTLELDTLVREVALDLPRGSFVNLGIGLPTRIARHLDADRDVTVHSENGILGVTALDDPAHADPDLIDAGKQPVGLRPGGAYLSHVDSFALIRGGHLDVAVMGAYEVSATGDLANWSAGERLPGVGGAMDLAVATPTVLVVMRHRRSDGGGKLVGELTLPATARGVVTRVYTDLGIFEPRGDHFLATALAPGVGPEEFASDGARIVLTPDPVTLPRPDPT